MSKLSKLDNNEHLQWEMFMMKVFGGMLFQFIV